MTSRRDAAAVDGLPPLAPADAAPDERGRAIEARLAARHGAPTLAELHRAYAGFGAEWPGDDEVRRRRGRTRGVIGKVLDGSSLSAMVGASGPLRRG